MNQNPKPGFQSSEFYVTVIATIVMIALNAGVITPDVADQVNQAAPTIAQGILDALVEISKIVGLFIPSIAYNNGRAKVKAK